MSSNLSDVHRDQIGHFILRLAYCRSEDLRRWFLTQECMLFKNRLDNMSDEDRERFMITNGLRFDSVSDAEKHARMHKLVNLAGVNENNFGRTSFYRVPFVQALSLIGNRSVYLERGMAFVPLNRVVSILITKFRTHLSRALALAASAFEVIGGDSRIFPLLKGMSKQFLGQDFNNRQAMNAGDKLTLEKIDEAAGNHFPLCMQRLHAGLNKEHKLKHWGRLQYTLFLKGAGLSLEDASAYFQRHFTRLMTVDQFQKGYAYSLRHMFGKEGARKNYTPYSCMKIILGNAPEPGAHHGCPYKHAPDGQLVQMLSGLKLGLPEVKEIVTLAKHGPGGAANAANYQLACQKHFDLTHPNHLNIPDIRSESVANHPNQWFQASLGYHRAKNGQSTASASATSSTADVMVKDGADGAMAVDEPMPVQQQMEEAVAMEE